MRALHCLYDEKFIDGAISLFETDKRIENDYILFCSRKRINDSFKYIKSPLVGKANVKDFASIANNYDVIYLHSLYSINPNLILKLDKRIRVVWFAWGWDLYNKYVIPINLYGDRTKAFLLQNIRFRGLVDIKKRVIELRRSFLLRNIESVLNRIDYFSGVFPYEFDLLKIFWPSIKAQQVDFYYGSTNFFIPETADYNIKNSFLNIIIGNSNSPENNHLDAFTYLCNLKLESGGKVILPLSYGDNKLYKETLLYQARQLWNDNLVVLDHYLPLEDYLHIVSNCRVAIYFHERQQASDNVLMQLLYGAKVFMSESSLMFQHLKQLGFNIFSLQKDYEGINSRLSNDEIIHNRELLSRLFSSTKLVDRTKNIISKLSIANSE